MEKSNHEFDFLFLCKSNVMQGNPFFVGKKILPIFLPPFFEIEKSKILRMIQVLFMILKNDTNTEIYVKMIIN